MIHAWEHLPSAWRSIEDEPPPPHRARVTLRLDTDMVKFYRAMGPGDQSRINAILRAYILARLAKVIEGPLDQDWLGRPV